MKVILSSLMKRVLRNPIACKEYIEYENGRKPYFEFEGQRYTMKKVGRNPR